MIRARVAWQGPQVSQQLVALAWRRLQKAVLTYHSLLQAALNTANPRPYKTPSKPGEPPRKRTGWLESHVLYEMDDGTHSARVGVPRNRKPYGLWLELGTRLMKPRPWLMATLRKHWDRIAAIAAGK